MPSLIYLPCISVILLLTAAAALSISTNTNKVSANKKPARLSLLTPSQPGSINQNPPLNILPGIPVSAVPVSSTTPVKNANSHISKIDSLSLFGTPREKLSEESSQSIGVSDLAQKQSTTNLNYYQSQELADSIAEYITHQLPKDSALFLAPPKGTQTHSSLSITLADSLTKAGFALVRSKSPDASVLRYQLSQFDNGFWLRIQLNNTRADRFYFLDASNSLVANAPFSVKGAE